MTAPVIAESVTCLGCGCACDDIAVVVHERRIVETRNACVLGVHWFGDGQLDSVCRVDGRETDYMEAMAVAADRLGRAKQPLVYLAPGSSCETQRAAAAIADVLRGRLDSATSAAASAILASQEHGLASATLGEVRNRADMVVFWGVDIAGRYPRFGARYAPDPVGTHVPQGRASRNVIAVDVGEAAATIDADRRFAVDPADEVAVLTALEALARSTSDTDSRYASLKGAAWQIAREISAAMRAGRYVAIIYDAEPDDRAPRSRVRFDALASLSQSLNDRTRCAAIGLRAGGNRSGADAVLTAQTGYPFAVDFSRGAPRYDAHAGSALGLIERGEVDVALVVGDATLIRPRLASLLTSVDCIIVGPHAANTTLGSAHVVISTGADGIHSSGTAIRTDDVPLPLRAPLTHPLPTVAVAHGLAIGVRAIRLHGLVGMGFSQAGPRPS